MRFAPPTLARYTPALAAAVLLALPQTAGAYAFRLSRDGRVLAWEAAEVEVLVDTRGSGVRGALDAVRAGFRAWTDAGLPVRVALRPANRPLREGTDGVNVVRWETRSWPHGAEVVGLTFSSYRTDTAALVESDVVFNAVDVRWTTDPARHPGRFDVQNIATHEAGHFFGLAHEPDRPDATMFEHAVAGETAKRDLSDDDRQAIAVLARRMAALRRRRAPSGGAVVTGGDARVTPVRRTAAPKTATRVTVGCAAAGGEDGGAGLAALAALFMLARRRRRRRPGALPLLIVAAACAAEPGPARATVVRALTLDELAARADIVIEAWVGPGRSRVAGAMIVTDHPLILTRCYKGPCAGVHALRTLGGEVEGRGMVVEGAARPRPHRRVVAFARRRGRIGTPVGMAQGLFVAEGADLVRDTRGLLLLDATGRIARGSRERVPRAALLAAVRRARVGPRP